MGTFNDLYEVVMARDCARLRQLVWGGADINCRDSMRRTVLHHAATYFWSDGMKDVIRTLVDLGADINAADLNRMTPLHYTLSRGAADIERDPLHLLLPQCKQHSQTTDIESRNRFHMAIKFLVELGADINAQFDLGVTSLNRAIQLKNIRGIETLLRLGVDTNAPKWIDCTALHTAIGPHATILLPGLVALGADVNSLFTSFPPLLEAVELGRMDIIKLLVQHGADVNVYRIDNQTPVIYATEQRLPDVVKSLAQLGADLNAKRYRSSTVNEIVKVGRVDILEYLVKCGVKIHPLGSSRTTALGIALTRKNFHETCEMMDCLVKAGADVNARYDASIAALVTAVRRGHTGMVRALAKLYPYRIDSGYLCENITALYHVCSDYGSKDINTMELLLKHGANVNLKYDLEVSLVHAAVAQGNGQMLRVLAELGANLDYTQIEGDLVQNVLQGNGCEDKMAMIKLLIDAGLDLNQCYSKQATPLHYAVRRGDANMVHVLRELKADMNAKKGCFTPILSAIGAQRTDVVRYFVQNGANVNSRFTSNVTPLHDAVNQGNVYIVHVLISSGADTKCGKNINTPLGYAIKIGNNEVVKCLLECQADMEGKISLEINPLHDAVENSNLRIISALSYYRSLDVNNATPLREQVTPLQYSILLNSPDITETLLKHGADMNCLQYIMKTPLDVAMDQGKVECALFMISKNVTAFRDTTGLSPLHYACQLGHIDQARLLIIEGNDVNKLDYFRRKPLQCLPLANTADHHVLQETATAAKVKEQVPTSFISISGCQDMTTSLHTPGIGDVHWISTPSATEISERVTNLLDSTIHQCKAFSERKLKPIGSVAEGTRVGLPNEMDFLFEMKLDTDQERNIADLGCGYAIYHYAILPYDEEWLTWMQQFAGKRTGQVFPDQNSGSATFHSDFNSEVMNQVLIHEVTAEKVSICPATPIGITDTNRKACSLLRLDWDDGMSAFCIPADIVPCLHINNWPEGGTTRTWLMDEQELRSHGYVLVPKPPHAKSDLARECTEEELHNLWKISFPHLETEHMQRLEQRVKDVYITAKCLKNPDVCRIMITDDGSLPRSVGRYVTSYMLKMCFFQNVDFFRKHHMSLEEMVCKVYDDLVIGLSKNFIPIFFLPNVSALNGVKVDVPKSAKVAKIMARFVRALYLRDSLGEITDGGDDMVMTVYQRNPGSVYRVYDISNEDV